MNQKQERLFKEYTVWRAIFTMAVPAVVNILVMVLYNMADMFFVARLHDDAQVAAISIVAPAFTMMMAPCWAAGAAPLSPGPWGRGTPTG